MKLAGVVLLGALSLGACAGPATPVATDPVSTQAAAPVRATRENVPATAIPAQIAPAVTPVPTAVRVPEHTVVEGDTLWDIAVTFDVSLDEMIGAPPPPPPPPPPPGDVISIPLPGTIDVSRLVRPPTATPTGAIAASTQGSPKARVAADAGGLRLRKGPSTSDDVIVTLAEYTPLTIQARSADGAWFEVALPDGARGWVMARYVDTGPAPAGGLAQVDAKHSEVAPLSAQSLPRAESYLSGFTTRAQAIFQAGQALGNRANVFAVIGDSNSASPLFLEPFDHGNYDLGEYGYLEDTIRYFKGSFRFTSVAAVVGFDALKLMDPARADATRCQAGESPLACEYRLKKPGVALILIGTNDSTNWRNFEANYRPLIEYTISKGIIPVLLTKGDDLESKKYNAPPDAINTIIVRLSREYGVPLLDLYQVAARLPGNGFGSDGFHFNVPPDAKTAYFTGAHMNYGYTIRNLTALQALDAVRRLVLND